MMSPVYGLTANVSLRGVVRDFLKGFLDLVYRV
jgi:hypothetical protein